MDTEKLKAKLIQLCVLRHDLELEKKEMLSAHSSQLRDYKKQIEAISETLDKDDPMRLEKGGFDDEDLKDLLGSDYDMFTSGD